MHTPVKLHRLVGLALSAAVAGVLGASAGCDDTRAADNRVQEKLVEARAAALSAGEEGGEAALKLYEEAARDAEAGPAAQAQAKARLAEQELSEGVRLLREVEAANLEIARLVYEIQLLGGQIGGGNTMIAAYKAAQPTEVASNVEKLVSEAQGGADKPAWFDNEGKPLGTLPTLAAARQEISRIEGEIAQRQQKIQQLTEQRTAAQREAETLARQADAATGRAGVDAFKRAAEVRKNATALANQIDTLQSQLPPLQRQVERVTAQQQAVEAALAAYQQQLGQVQEGYKGIEVQMQALTALSASLAGDAPGAPTTQPVGTVAGKAAQLSQLLTETQQKFRSADVYLGNAAQHFSDAAEAAQRFTADANKAAQELDKATAAREAFDAATDAVNPAVYRLGQAQATQLQATLHASRAATYRSLADLTAALKQVLEQAGMKLPAPLAEADFGADFDQALAKANELYDGASEQFLNVTDMPAASEARKNSGRVMRIFALYGKAQLARATGDPDKQGADLLAAAVSQRELAEENNARLPPLPSELAGPPKAPTTAPAATTPAAPAAAPGPDGAPAPEAAPAPDGAAPAPDGAAPPPAPAPADTPVEQPAQPQ